MEDINLLLIGAGISLIATIIGYFAQTVVNNIFNSKGKVNIYVKSVYNKFKRTPWGFDPNGIFDVPLWIEIHNTKGKNEIIRNMNLKLYFQGKEVGKTVQISHVESGERKLSYGNEGAYSFLINPYSIERYELDFSAKKNEINSDFDEVRISFFDSKDKYKEYKLFEVKNSWKVTINKIDDDWRLLK